MEAISTLKLWDPLAFAHSVRWDKNHIISAAGSEYVSFYNIDGGAEVKIYCFHVFIRSVLVKWLYVGQLD